MAEIDDIWLRKSSLIGLHTNHASILVVLNLFSL